jgi:hypothetical protein
MPLKILGMGKLASKAYDAYQIRKAARKAKMVNRVISKVLTSMGLQNVSKMVAVPVGMAVGWAVTHMPFLAPLLTEEWVAGITLTIATAIVGAFPANVPPAES